MRLRRKKHMHAIWLNLTQSIKRVHKCMQYLIAVERRIDMQMRVISMEKVQLALTHAFSYSLQFEVVF